MSYDLAQVNFARPAYGLESPELADFVTAALDPVNAAADVAPEAYMACWWVPAGHRPTVQEAEDRVALLRRYGPTSASFRIKRHFAAVRQAGPVRVIERDEWMCGV